MGTDVTIVAAFLAGIFSFTSPCVLPLVPIFLAHLAGVSVGESGRRARASLLRNSAAYVAGFSVVFIAIGIAAGAAGLLVDTADILASNRLTLVRIGGALLVLLGLRQIGIISMPYLDRERRFGSQSGHSGSMTSSFFIGVTFGAGWSPCIGPILGIILTMAANSADTGRAALLLGVYSVGLGLPFMLSAVTFGSSPTVIRGMNRHLGTVTTISGAIMLGMGAIMLLGIYERFFVEMVRLAPWTPWEPSV